MADTDDNLELNPNNVIVTTETPSGTSSDNSETEEEVAIPRLALEEDVDIAEAEADTPELVVEEAVDIAEADIGTPKLIENDVIEEADNFFVEENPEVEEVEVDWQVPGGWFYFSKPGSSPPYRTVQPFPGWKSVYQQVPWLYPRRWPARPLLTNEVGEETKGYKSKPSHSYPFYAFRKISH